MKEFCELNGGVAIWANRDSVYQLSFLNKIRIIHKVVAAPLVYSELTKCYL